MADGKETISNLKTELEQVQSELAITEKLSEKSRERQLELEEKNAKLKDEIVGLKIDLEGKSGLESEMEELYKKMDEMKAKNPNPKEFKETSKLVVTLQEENDKLKQELRDVTNNSRHRESHFALDYAMTRDEQLKELATKNFELFNQLNTSKETVERARQDVNDMATKLHKKKIRLKELHKVIRLERDRKSKAENEAQKMKEKVAALTKHIEKLMVALRLHAQAQARTKEEKKLKERQLKKTKKKANLTRNKAFLSSRVIAQLRQQVDMLTGQLRLADDRFAELRGVIDVERRTSQSNIKRMARDLQKRIRSDEESKEWMMEQTKQLQRQQDDIARKRLQDEKRIAKQKEELRFRLQEAQERQIAAEANAAKLQKKFQQHSQSVPNLNMTNDVGTWKEKNVPLYGTLPDINSPGEQTLSLADEAKAQKLRERDQRLALGREQQAKREKEKQDMYYWRD